MSSIMVFMCNRAGPDRRKGEPSGRMALGARPPHRGCRARGMRSRSDHHRPRAPVVRLLPLPRSPRSSVAGWPAGSDGADRTRVHAIALRLHGKTRARPAAHSRIHHRFCMMPKRCSLWRLARSTKPKRPAPCEQCHELSDPSSHHDRDRARAASSVCDGRIARRRPQGEHRPSGRWRLWP